MYKNATLRQYMVVVVLVDNRVENSPTNIGYSVKEHQNKFQISGQECSIHSKGVTIILIIYHIS